MTKGGGIEAGRSARDKSNGMTALGRLRAYLVAGILVTTPAFVTIYIGWAVIVFVDGVVADLFPPIYNPNTYLPFQVPGAGILTLSVALILVGYVATGLFGSLLVRMTEGVLARMPVVRSVYGAVKQIVETVLAERSEAFREVVLVEFPRPGMWCLAFVTGTTTGEIQNITAEEMVNVFVPTTPNPTSGYLVFVPRREIVDLHMSVEDGLKMIVSGGIITPPDPRPEVETAPNPSGPSTGRVD